MRSVVVSTSSPVASVGLYEGTVLVSAREERAEWAASRASLHALEEVLEEAGWAPRDVGCWIADIGPGSFTGVRVGVMLVKAIAFALGKPVSGLSAFDLIGPTAAAIPVRRGQYLLRELPGEEPRLVGEDDPRLAAASGYGERFEEPVYPSAARAGQVLAKAVTMRPEELAPAYILEPSISKPKVPYPERRT